MEKIQLILQVLMIVIPKNNNMRIPTTDQQDVKSMIDSL